MKSNTNYNAALATLVTVFFFWGFIAASNGVFIPFCKSYFHLDQFQSQLIDFAFYGAYYIGALLLFIVSGYVKTDILNKWGFKNGIIYGLLLSALGAAIMIPAISSGSFEFILAALFVVQKSSRTQNIYYIFISILICVIVFYFKDLSVALGQTDRIPILLSIWAPLIALSLFILIGLLQINEK